MNRPSSRFNMVYPPRLASYCGRPPAMHPPFVRPVNAPRVLGQFARIGFERAPNDVFYRNAVCTSWLGVNERGRLEIKSEDFSRAAVFPVRWIMYEAIDNRFGQKGRAFHIFGEAGGELPRLVKCIDGIWELQGGAYTVGPEGIRD